MTMLIYIGIYMAVGFLIWGINMGVKGSEEVAALKEDAGAAAFWLAMIVFYAVLWPIVFVIGTGKLIGMFIAAVAGR